MNASGWELLVPALAIAMASVPLDAQGGPRRSSGPPERRYLALGDSYTIGEGVHPTLRWPMQLAVALNDQGLNMVDIRFIAKTGWTTDELDRAITNSPPTGTFDVVTLLVGVNDQYRGRPAAGFRAPFRALLARAVKFAGGRASRVIVVSIPDWGVTPFAKGRDKGAIANGIDAYNAIAKDEAKKAGAHWVDVTGVSRETQSDWTTGDGLHPSGSQYARWKELVLPVAVSFLK